MMAAKTNESGPTAGLFPANKVPQPGSFGYRIRANSVKTPTISRQPSTNFSANGNPSVTNKGADSEKPQSDDVDKDGWKIFKPKSDNTSDKKVKVNDENKPPVDPNPNNLPAVVDEGEEIVFIKLVKLYRHMPGYYDELGIGHFKVLKDPRTGKFRCVMKPYDQEKPNADFPITGDMVLLKRDDGLVFTLACTDFSENEQKGKRETFSMRFRPDDAEEFETKMREFIRQSA